MFPDRVFLGIGRGEALNEVTSGQSWPTNREKYRRIKEAIVLIKKLWNEDDRKYLAYTNCYIIEPFESICE